MAKHTIAFALSAVLAVTVLAGCTAPESVQATEFTIEMKDIKFNPTTLTVPVGATVTWVNRDPFSHNVDPTDKAFWGTEGSGEAPATWLKQGESWSFTFTEEGTYKYYCKPHASQGADGEWKGMTGTIIVKAGAAAGGESEQAKTPGSALPIDIAEIGRSGADVPAPIGARGPEHVTFDIESTEVTALMADGTTYTYWTFDNTVPGPMLRVREGDTVTVNLHNSAQSTMGHNIDLHAVTGPGGGAHALSAEPGKTASLTFKALNPGLFVYHCAFQDPPLHIAHGMYGLILVEPAGGLPPVDKEFYVVQSDFYSPFEASQKGHHPFDGTRAAREDPTFVVFNGRMGSLTGERRLEADVGDTVRVFIGDGGPNLVSSFHIIGEIFDRAWEYGGLDTAPHENAQTILVPAGGAAIVEFGLEVPGDYYLVDHSIFRVHKGAFGVLHAAGEDDPEVFRAG